MSSYPELGYIVYHHSVDPFYDDLGKLVTPGNEFDRRVYFEYELSEFLRSEAFNSRDLVKSWLDKQARYSPKDVACLFWSQLSRMEEKIKTFPEYEKLGQALLRPVRLLAKVIAEYYPMESKWMPDNLRDLIEGSEADYLESNEFAVGPLASAILDLKDKSGEPAFFDIDNYKDETALRSNLANFITQNWEDGSCRIVFARNIKAADYLVYLICEHRNYQLTELEAGSVIWKKRDNQLLPFKASQCSVNRSKCLKSPDDLIFQIGKMIDKHKR